MKLLSVKFIFIIVALITLSGCSTLGWQRTPLLAIPEQVSYDGQVKLAQVSQQLGNPKLDSDARMQLFFERGTIYHSLGFDAFAQSDLMQVLNLGGEVADVYNYLGLFAAKQQDWDSAYMAFNTALELSPDYEFAAFNRGLVSYRIKRYNVAKDDFLTFYNNNPEDPTRSLWLYLVEQEADSRQAKKLLQQRFDAMENKDVWGSDIIKFYLGQISESELMKRTSQDAENNRDLAQRLCEVYFYLGKYYLSKGDEARAETLFKYALANNIYNYVEHSQALQELLELQEQR